MNVLYFVRYLRLGLGTLFDIHWLVVPIGMFFYPFFGSQGINLNLLEIGWPDMWSQWLGMTMIFARFWFWICLDQECWLLKLDHAPRSSLLSLHSWSIPNGETTVNPNCKGLKGEVDHGVKNLSKEVHLQLLKCVFSMEHDPFTGGLAPKMMFFQSCIYLC